MESSRLLSMQKSLENDRERSKMVYLQRLFHRIISQINILHLNYPSMKQTISYPIDIF
jgi:hypothetical protein